MSLGGKSDFILARQVQITARKIRGVLKRSPVGELDVAPLAADQPIGLEALEDAVDVNRREAGRISELLLGHRQFEPVLGSEPARFEAFAKRVSDLTARLDALAPRVDALAVAQAQALDELAIASLEEQKQRLAGYTAQARIAVAQLYDRATLGPAATTKEGADAKRP